MECPPPPPRPEGAVFLADLASGRQITQRIALVFAHPDDEAIAAGGQIHRFPDPVLICATDGAPRDERDMRRLGFASLEAYAQIRRMELTQALQRTALSNHALIQLNLPDGELIFAMDVLVKILAETFERNETQVVITHAYEGGHPDHDALALAAQLARRRCAHPPVIVEAPYYHSGPHGWELQTFPDNGPTPVTVKLSGEAWSRKCDMLDAHHSQAEMLSGFRQPIETFRLAPAYDFLQPPNGGRWLYDQVAPTLHPELWLAYARAALVAEGGA